MKNKIVIPIISIALVLIAVVSAFVSVKIAKNKEVCLSETDISFSGITVDGNKMKVTITSANSLGMKITNNSYSYEDGTLKFKVYGKKDLEIGKPLAENQVVTLVITAPSDIKEIYFVYLDDKDNEKESLKSFQRGTI